MAKKLLAKKSLFLGLLAIIAPFCLFSCLTENKTVIAITVFFALFALFMGLTGLWKIPFDPKSKNQKRLFALACVALLAFSFFLCGISIEDEWLFDYPLEGSVDDYGCYPQMFDAFQKGQLNIDTDYDLSVIASLENPYDTPARREATGERFGVIWDRAFYDGKLYSYFGIAPIFYLYYPAYFLTGQVLSDALAATLMASACSVVLMLLLWELCRRMKNKPPFALMVLGGMTLSFGGLLFPTLTNANFYHLAVLSGILAVSAFFLFVLKAEGERDSWKRKLFFALAGISVGVIAASRPNLVLYVFIALPLLISVIAKRPNGLKSLFLDIIAFVAPMAALGALIMLYNNARFGSPFDFGSEYQLTLTDTSTYGFEPTLFMPAIYHYFLTPPVIDGVFPYIHVAANRFKDYGVDRLVYVSKSMGAMFFPAVWGGFLLPALRKNKMEFITGVLTVIITVFLAYFDMCYGGVHLRYGADIMFVLTILGVYLVLRVISGMKNHGAAYKAFYVTAVLMFALTVFVNLPLCLDNERDMVLKYHREIYSFLASVC